MNDKPAAIVASHPRRFRAVAILPVVAPEAMVVELYRAVKELGFVSAHVAVGPTARRLDHPDCEASLQGITSLSLGTRVYRGFGAFVSLGAPQLARWSVIAFQRLPRGAIPTMAGHATRAIFNHKERRWLSMSGNIA